MSDVWARAEAYLRLGYDQTLYGDALSLQPLVRDLRDALADYDHLFELQSKRLADATAAWRMAHPGNDLVVPDLGDLLRWQLARITLLEADDHATAEVYKMLLDAERAAVLRAETAERMIDAEQAKVKALRAALECLARANALVGGCLVSCASWNGNDCDCGYVLATEEPQEFIRAALNTNLDIPTEQPEPNYRHAVQGKETR